MPQINYFNDNSDAGDITPSFAATPKKTNLGPSEVLDSTLGEYLNHPDKDVVVIHKGQTPGPSEKNDELEAFQTPRAEEKLFDVVNKPRHYNLGKVECIDAIEAATIGLHGIKAVCAGNVIKYTWRHHHKNGVQDLEKARFYLDKLISLQKEDKNGHSRKD